MDDPDREAAEAEEGPEKRPDERPDERPKERSKERPDERPDEEPDEGPEGGPKWRLSPERRTRFLEVLGETGNRRMAAEAIGIEPRLMDQRRRSDRGLDRDWRAALARSQRRLSGADGPFDCGRLNAIRRGRGGRLQLVAAGEKRWTAAKEDLFLAALAMTSNVAASARAIGFTEGSAWQRRRKWPDFARRMDSALDDAEVRLEFRLAGMGSDTRAAAAELGIEPPAALPPGDRAIPFDPDLALRFLRFREDKRRGGRRRGGCPRREPSIEQVRDEILRRIAALRRHRERGGE